MKDEAITLNSFEAQMFREAFKTPGAVAIDGFERMANQFSAEYIEDEDYVLQPRYADAARKLVNLSLHQEFTYIEGLCTRGMTAQALERINSQYGPKFHISMYEKLARVESDEYVQDSARYPM